MTQQELNAKAADQHKRNLESFGHQSRAVLILEAEDQVAKLRDAFLHRTQGQVQRRIINIMSLMYGMTEN